METIKIWQKKNEIQEFLNVLKNFASNLVNKEPIRPTGTIEFTKRKKKRIQNFNFHKEPHS